MHFQLPGSGTERAGHFGGLLPDGGCGEVGRRKECQTAVKTGADFSQAVHIFFSSDSHFFLKRFTFFSQAKISGCSCRRCSKSVCPCMFVPKTSAAMLSAMSGLASFPAVRLLPAGRIFCFPAGCPGLRTGDFSGRLLFPVICCFLYKPPRFPFGCLLVLLLVLLMWLAVFF